MPKKGRVARSMRGTAVDFDLLEIQQQLSSAPKTAEVKAREDFVDRKMRRRQRVAERAKQLADRKQAPVEVEPAAPTNNETVEEVRHLAETPPVVDVPKETKTPTRKKRTIRKKKTDETK